MSCDHQYKLTSKIVENNDLLYSCDGRPDYLSVFYHRSQGRAGDKGRWAISREQETSRFYCAYDSENFTETYFGLWHIENENIFVGQDDELIAYFPAPANANERWHGYPFTFNRKSPPDRIKALKEVAERLFEKEFLSLRRITKIRTGVL